MRLPDESISFQNTTGDAGMENLYIYGKLNYNFENDDITSKSINAGSGQFNNISLNTINATSHITTTATITALDLTATNNVSVGSSVTAGSFYGDGSNLTGIEAFVKGMIILWYGDTSTIPNGFVLCDGTNDTPDLRDKFVIGAGNNYNVDDTGGSTTETVNISGSDTVNISGSDTVSISGTTGAPVSSNLYGLGDVGGSNKHVHSFSGSATVNITASDTVNISGSDTVNTLPPYYALCYIYCTAAGSNQTFVGLDDTPSSFTADKWLKGQ